jgi:hypothetical protein
MAVAYDIKAIPTVYGARQYRSRLEAKWASFFDLAGWKYEYEPFDLGAWSPDFMLIGKSRVLVEVKPITDLDDDTAARMAQAAVSAKWDGDLLLLGVAPLFNVMHCLMYRPGAIGWLGEHSTTSDEFPWSLAAAGIPYADPGSVEFMSDQYSYSGRMHGDGYKACCWPEDSGWLKSRWDRAANRVQWHKR